MTEHNSLIERLHIMARNRDGIIDQIVKMYNDGELYYSNGEINPKAHEAIIKFELRQLEVDVDNRHSCIKSD